MCPAAQVPIAWGMSVVASAAAPPRELARRLRSALWGLYGLLGLLLLAYFAVLVVRPAARDSLLLSGWGAASFEIVVSVLVLLRALTSSRDPVVPLALGTAMLMWGLGDAVLTFESQHGMSTTSPSAADLFYLAFFPLAYLALVLMVRRDVSFQV